MEKKEKKNHILSPGCLMEGGGQAKLATEM